MKKLGRVLLSKYTMDRKNSLKGEKTSRNSPGYPAEIALKILTVFYEEKVSLVKELRVGDEIEFEIDQEIHLDSPSPKDPSGEINAYTRGIGTGVVEGIIWPEANEDEYVEAWITLKDGYAEDLEI